MKIGVAQIRCEERRIDLNIKTHLSVLDDAAKRGCRYVLFPELSLTGYFPEQLKEYSPHLIEVIANDFSHVAKKMSINFTIGCPLWHENKVFIGAITFLANGETVEHQKRLLSGNESNFVSKGTASPNFTIENYKFQLCICAELKERAFFNDAVSQNVDLYCVSALITARAYAKESAILQEYSSNGISVLLSNHYGVQGELNAAGRSAFWNKKGMLLNEAGFHETLLIVNLGD